MKKILVFIILFIFSFCLYGCSNNENIDTSDTDITSVEDKMNGIIENDNYIIVDVRTSEEYNEGHVVGAINIPYDQIDENSNLDKTKTIMVYCKSGKRSSIAYNTLESLGYDTLDLGAYESINLEKE